MRKSVYIQRKRTKGFSLQAQSPDGRPVVSCTRPGPFGNPFYVEFFVGYDENFWLVKRKGSKAYYYYHVSKEAALRMAIIHYKNLIEENNQIVGVCKKDLNPEWHNDSTIEHHLKGKHLSCFCPPGSPCHVQDVLLPIINGEPFPEYLNRPEDEEDNV